MNDDDLDDFLDELDYYDDMVEFEDGMVDFYDDEIESTQEMLQSELDEIDEYWDRENEYIRSSGIYSEEEVQTILENHEEIRRSKKDESELESLRFDKEMAVFDRQQAKEDRSSYLLEKRLEIQEEQAYRARQQAAAQSYEPEPQRPGLLKRMFTAASAYYWFEKLIGKKR